ncbi:MAG: sulfurtransferase [Alphaproteobacteria bacterium]|jgi:thiosulfate/3-mercaptopyruvate sulfurtransferase|nr:sulfurtransferase [Alphaproteobacteria bacterium]
MRPFLYSLSLILILFAAPFGHANILKPLVQVNDITPEVMKKIRLVDIRSLIEKDGKKIVPHSEGHIPGAIAAPYPKSWRVKQNDIPGMLPDISALEAFLGSLGIDEQTHVVIYSEGKSPTDIGAATRVYWTLKYLGHDQVSLLDGGFDAWEKANRPLSTQAQEADATIFTANPRPELLSTTSQIAALDKNTANLVDGRPEAQFLGKEKHPLASRFGRIKDSIWFDQASQFQPGTAYFLPLDTLRTQNQNKLDITKPVVSYCNSGHWAANNWFVLHELLEIPQVSLYDGSMLAWSKDTKLAMESDRTRFDDLKSFLSAWLQ